MFKLKYSAYCGSLSAVLLPVLLTSCALPPPARDLHNLTPQGTYRQATPPDEHIPASEAAWWAQFDDPRLLQLIEHAQQANPDILIALQRVQEARAGMRAALGATVPSLSLAASASDSSSGLPDPVKQGVPDTRNRTVGLDTRWEIDLSGALREQYSAAQHDALAADWGVRGAQLMVKGEVARQYFLWQGALARQSLLQQIIQRQEQQLALLQLRLDAGLASPLQRDQLAAALNSQRAELPALHSLQMACENHLAVLLGQSPSQPRPDRYPARALPGTAGRAAAPPSRSDGRRAQAAC
ncbi:TolC family protein [Paludibacterium sp. B53371]|uniref:TolC family protein n=1 Tax=Paludibacterium sp. B53371 TaxID=2806263 RepID=UPI001C04FE48|nr:TolC family protein [Paludibacterium sp. B53371]